MSRQVSSSRPYGSFTTTLTLEHPSPQQRPQQHPTLTLHLTCPQTRRVTWKEGTVDNEFLQRKSSKKCCIFHKDKPFDEDNSDEEDGHNRDRNHNESNGSKSDGSGDCCSKSSEASSSANFCS